MTRGGAFRVNTLSQNHDRSCVVRGGEEEGRASRTASSTLRQPAATTSTGGVYGGGPQCGGTVWVGNSGWLGGRISVWAADTARFIKSFSADKSNQVHATTSFSTTTVNLQVSLFFFFFHYFMYLFFFFLLFFFFSFFSPSLLSFFMISFSLLFLPPTLFFFSSLSPYAFIIHTP